jgi:hypothetical protein
LIFSHGHPQSKALYLAPTWRQHSGQKERFLLEKRKECEVHGISKTQPYIYLRKRTLQNDPENISL